MGSPKRIKLPRYTEEIHWIYGTSLVESRPKNAATTYRYLHHPRSKQRLAKSSLVPLGSDFAHTNLILPNSRGVGFGGPKCQYCCLTFCETRCVALFNHQTTSSTTESYHETQSVTISVPFLPEQHRPSPASPTAFTNISTETFSVTMPFSAPAQLPTPQP